MGWGELSHGAYESGLLALGSAYRTSLLIHLKLADCRHRSSKQTGRRDDFVLTKQSTSTLFVPERLSDVLQYGTCSAAMSAAQLVNGHARPKVLIPEKVSPDGLKLLQASLEVHEKKGLTPEQLEEIIGEYDALIIRSETKVTAQLLAAGKKLYENSHATH